MISQAEILAKNTLNLELIILIKNVLIFAEINIYHMLVYNTGNLNFYMIFLQINKCFISSYQCFCGDSYGKYGQANSRDCDVACPGNSTQMCGGGWRNSVFEVAVLPDPCLANPSPCGIGAICKRLPGGLAQCSCPPGTTGNATIRCCKSISCGCWGGRLFIYVFI